MQDSLAGPAYLRLLRCGVRLPAPKATLQEAESVAKAETAVLEHIPGLRRYARALTGNAAEADDLVQECLSRALARCRRTEDGRSDAIRNLRAYLFTILHNAHVDRLNERRRWSYALPDEALDNLLARPAPQDGQMALHDLAEALTRLPEEQRQAVLLVGYEGMTYKDASAVLSVPIGTVMSRLSRGREALRRLMNGEPLADLRRVPAARPDAPPTFRPALRKVQ
ncbi:MAG: sigma-70 family RNA polymerase sigma factor [Kiloniellaceae bacterium]